MRIAVIDDSVPPSRKDAKFQPREGGTRLTSYAIFEQYSDDVQYISPADLKFIDCVEKDCIWVICNVFGALTPESTTNILWLLRNRTCFKIEFDYGFCFWRCPTGHRHFKNEDCNCFHQKVDDTKLPPVGVIYKEITERCRHIFYMSQKQLELHIQYTQKGNADRSVLSSCFTKKTFDSFDKLRSNTKNEEYLIIAGEPGWHREAKGVETSIAYAKKHELKYNLVATKTHDEMLEKMSRHKGLIFLPYIEDTCPRVVIEAKLLGLELLINQNCQHITEGWWRGSIEEISNYLKQRPQYLRETIEKYV